MYVVSIDLGGGNKGSYSVANFFKWHDELSILEQVSIIRTNIHTVEEFSYFVIEEAERFSYPVLIFERNGEWGEKFHTLVIEKMGYENVLRTEEGSAGIRTTETTKALGVVFLKRIMQKRLIVIHDTETLVELTNFVVSSGNKMIYHADTGYTDDIVMTMILMAYAYSRYPEQLPGGIEILKSLLGNKYVEVTRNTIESIVSSKDYRYWNINKIGGNWEYIRGISEARDKVSLIEGSKDKIVDWFELGIKKEDGGGSGWGVIY